MTTVFAALAGAGVVLLLFHRKRARRAEEARSLARDLVSEIRAVMASCESAGAPMARERFALVRHRLPGALSKEAAFAVEAFYRSVDEYAEAAREMVAAFAKESALRLGDKVRAKDRRDRCLKDVYDSGAGALERLQKIG